jgi:pimeloyl-ACP methyl ester carboxylesterase
MWLGLGLGLILLLVLGAHVYIMWAYMPHLVRNFQERPFFLIPAGQPIADAENVRIPTSNGLTLCGCYLRAPRTGASGPRKGVILFGLEFGANRWSCGPYCEFLREQGFDIFSFETRNQGDSDSQPGYEPMQWVTDYELGDFRAALAYLKARPDADPNGIGFFGISKGGSAGLIAAAEDPYIRCCVTDGIFASHTTIVPYMKKWILIYCRHNFIAKGIPDWYYRWAAYIGMRKVENQRQCHFPHLEDVIGQLGSRPLLMIHGGGDSYIWPEMGRALFDLAPEPKEFWLVDGAKHNQALQVANGHYKSRVLSFFQSHLAHVPAAAADSGPAAAPVEATPAMSQP